MALYEIQKKPLKMIKLTATDFSVENIKERYHLQQILKKDISIIDSNLMVIAEEFSDWDESKRRIDLLCLDKEANLVVIELKTTNDGGHADLQAIRYASFLSTMTFDQTVKAHHDYLKKEFSSNQDTMPDPKENILSFLNWEDDNPDDKFAQEVKIIIASADFSKELISSVLWLNDYGINIRCIRMKPYKLNETILIDVEQIIPLPEAEDFQIKVKEKQQQERRARQSQRDYTKYHLNIHNEEYPELTKRSLMLTLIKALLNKKELTPSIIMNFVLENPNTNNQYYANNLFIEFDGQLTAEEVFKKLHEISSDRPKRFFRSEDDLFYYDGKTYLLSNQWGDFTFELATILINKFEPTAILTKN